jgi:hypothetical protein
MSQLESKTSLAVIVNLLLIKVKLVALGSPSEVLIKWGESPLA